MKFWNGVENPLDMNAEDLDSKIHLDLEPKAKIEFKINSHSELNNLVYKNVDSDSYLINNNSLSTMNKDTSLVNYESPIITHLLNTTSISLSKNKLSFVHFILQYPVNFINKFYNFLFIKFFYNLFISNKDEDLNLKCIDCEVLDLNETNIISVTEQTEFDLFKQFYNSFALSKNNRLTDVNNNDVFDNQLEFEVRISELLNIPISNLCYYKEYQEFKNSILQLSSGNLLMQIGSDIKISEIYDNISNLDENNTNNDLTNLNSNEMPLNIQDLEFPACLLNDDLCVLDDCEFDKYDEQGSWFMEKYDVKTKNKGAKQKKYERNMSKLAKSLSRYKRKQLRKEYKIDS